ncbi:MAG: hypothetical protein JWN70_1320, partial [Planctomycetaceae bacterium]|nr:hypothetical protein [Planctomycetaceae bacterium]
KTETAKGNLDKVLALKTERKRIEDGQPLARVVVPKYILTLRNSLETKVKAANTSYLKAAKVARNELLENLDQLVKDETKAGRIESAVAIRDTRKDLEKGNLPPAVEVAAAPQTKTPAPDKPNLKMDPMPNPAPDTPAEAPADPKVATKAPAKAAAKPTGKLGTNLDWKKIVASPAKVEVAEIDSLELTVNNGPNPFTQVPKIFTTHKATVYASPQQDGAGVAKIMVLADGFLLLGCNYTYQGNDSGGWTETRWLPEKFVSQGWRRLTAKELGGELVQNYPDKSVLPQDVFVKYVRQGEEMTLRCNKYRPPVVIVFDAEETK